MPSTQLSQYLRLRADGLGMEAAAFEAGIGTGEAKLHEAAIKRGELELPRACAPAPAHAREAGQSGETSMEDVQTTISVNGGPEHTLDEVREALDIVTSKPATDTGQRLKLFIERAERLDEEIKGLNSDKSDLFKEMKSEGFDTPTIKRIIKLRKMETHTRQEAEQLLSTYMDAIGMTPIEQAIALAA